jgi:FkbM family methyltransferase
LIRYETLFDTVVRNYSLIGDTNGERWLLSLIGHNPVVFDVGFHDGESTKHILDVRPGGTVFAFDPARSAREQYELRFVKDHRIVFENIGLSSQRGELTFYDYANMCNSFVRRREDPHADPVIYTVEVSTLDEVCTKRQIHKIDFLKIDAEGMDLNVLQGGKGLLLAQSVDMFMFEFASGWASTKRYLWEAVEMFQPLPYDLYHLFNGFLCPLRYNIRKDSCCTLPAMYVGLSHRRASRGDIPIRDYDF